MRQVHPGSRSFFGPVFFHDLVRSSRRGEQVGHRSLYALVLVGVVVAVYWSWFPGQGLEPLLRGTSMSISEQAQLASSFFSNFMAAQFVVVLLITPLYTAGTIAEQKERRTLDCLFVTDLSNREIILGMLGARVAKLLLLVMTGLPILSLLEFLGGVDPARVLAMFVATCMLMASVGSVSVLVSVYSRTVSAAAIISYVAALILVGVSFFVARLAGAYALAVPGNARWIVSLIVFWLLHAGIAILCCRRAIVQVRRVALAQADGSGRSLKPATSQATPRRPKLTFSSIGVRPRVGRNALLWKEIYAEGLGSVDLRWLNAGAALAGVLLVLFVANPNSPRWQGHIGGIEIVLTCILLLMIALSASRRVSRERERRTLDQLLLLPVSADAILFAKWLGSILSVRRLAWVFGAVWALGAATEALNVFAIPLLAAATAVYASFAACLGLWFSTAKGSTLRASLFTVLATLLFLAVPSALATAGGSSVNRFTQEPFGNWKWLLVEYGLSPPTTLWALTFCSADLLEGKNQLTAFAKILAAVVGLHGYLVATALLWIMTRARFKVVQSPGRVGRRSLSSGM
jgi:ABC-type transport system involved in multi-copper enzyme maturation permease subunit